LVDTGVDLNPDTAGNVVERVALDGGDGGDVWPGKHGTEMAMAMGAPINGWGTVGAWPLVKIVSVRVMAPGAGEFPFNAYAKGISTCLKRAGVRVINLSFSGAQPTNDEIAHLATYAAQARARDVSLVAGAGNAGGNVEWPAADPAIFAVGAAGPDGVLCDFSARGAHVLLAAAGCGLALADPATGEPVSFAGTSPAAAFTSAALAALRSYRPALSAEQAADLLVRTATNGILDSEAAFRAAGLGDAIDAAAARNGTPVPDPAPSNGPTRSSGIGGAGITGQPTPSGSERPVQATSPARLSFPRLRAMKCGHRAVVLALANRPSAATVVVRLYTRRTEFGGWLLKRLGRRDSRFRLRREYDYVTVQYVAPGLAPSAKLRVTGCGRRR